MPFNIANARSFLAALWSYVAAGGKAAWTFFTPAFSTLFSWVAAPFAWIMQQNVRIASLLKPLFMRAPWLARILQPLAVLNPLLSVLQLVAFFAALPRIIAAVSGAAMFVVTLPVELLTRAIKRFRKFFQKSIKKEWNDWYNDFKRTNSSIWYNWGQDNFVVRCARLLTNFASIFQPIVFTLITGPLWVIFGTVVKGFASAYDNAKKTSEKVWESDLIKMMRAPWDKVFRKEFIPYTIRQDDADIQVSQSQLKTFMREIQRVVYGIDTAPGIVLGSTYVGRPDSLKGRVATLEAKATGLPVTIVPAHKHVEIDELVKAVNQHAEAIDANTNAFKNSKAASRGMFGSARGKDLTGETTSIPAARIATAAPA